MAEHHKEVGIAYGPHSGGGYCAVVLLAQQVVAKDGKEYEEYVPKKKEEFTKNWEKFCQDIFTF